MDYDAAHLWITHLTVLWITGLRPCGLRCCASVDYACRARCGLRLQSSLWITLAGLAVDYDATHLWISGLGRRCGGWLRPHTPQAGLSPARFASCGCSSGAHGGGGGQEMQGDIAPCGTTDRDAAMPPLHLSSAPPSLIPHMQSFSVWSVFSVDSSHAGSPARSAFWCILCILWFPPHAVFFPCGPCFPWTLPTLAVLRVALFGVFCVFCGFFSTCSPFSSISWFLPPTCSAVALLFLSWCYESA